MQHLRIVKVVDQNLPYTILPECRKDLGDDRIAFAGKQPLQQGADARIRGDMRQLQGCAQAVTVILPCEPNFARQIAVEVQQITA